MAEEALDNNTSTRAAIGPPASSYAAIYFADAYEPRGSVYRATSYDAPPEMLYTRPSGRLYSFAFHPELPEKLYYVNANEYKIYRAVQMTGGNWSSEEEVFSHDTYMRDLAFAFDKTGELGLYFSEATGAASNGSIYKLVSVPGANSSMAQLFYNVSLSDVGGSWSGDFAFDNEGSLYLSSGNRIPASIFRVENGTGAVNEVFKDENESIKGLVYRAGSLYYANWDGNIYRLDLGKTSREVYYADPERTWTSDVGFREADPGSLPMAGEHSGS
jgi:hypothetical protein